MIAKLIIEILTTNVGIPPSKQCAAVTTVVALIADAPQTCAVKNLNDNINWNDVISVTMPPIIFGSVSPYPKQNEIESNTKN